MNAVVSFLININGEYARNVKKRKRKSRIYNKTYVAPLYSVIMDDMSLFKGHNCYKKANFNVAAAEAV